MGEYRAIVSWDRELRYVLSREATSGKAQNYYVTEPEIWQNGCRVGQRDIFRHCEPKHMEHLTIKRDLETSTLKPPNTLT
jgi:hypothetical protein